MEQIGLELVSRDPAPHATAAADHAERACPGWRGEAERLFLEFGRTRASGLYFLAEQAVSWAHEARGLADPPDRRAWGGIVQSLKRRGAIRGNGYAPAHDGSPKTLWTVCA